MSIDRVGEERDATTHSSQTSLPNEKYRIEEAEKERLAAIGQTVVTLFSLLNRAPPPHLTGVVVMQEKPSINEEPLTPSSETIVEQMETAPSQDNSIEMDMPVIEAEKSTFNAREEIAQDQTPLISPEIEVENQETNSPVEEALEPERTAEPLPLTPEQIHQMIQLYVEQIRFYADVAARERKLLASEEKIRFLQQLNSQQLASALNKNSHAKMQREQVIAQYEKEIEQAQQKIIELELLIQKQAH